MSYIQPQNTTVVYTQQPVHITNPFNEFNGDWNVGLMSCCDDMSQCKIIYIYNNVFFLLKLSIDLFY